LWRQELRNDGLGRVGGELLATDGAECLCNRMRRDQRATERKRRQKAGAVVLSNAKDLPFALSAADPSSLQRLLMLTRHQSANGKL
jgi:hypothetical protein